MASGHNNANSNSSNAKEQLLVCWLEPQSDAGKVSAIPISWIVSTISGDGRSPNSVVRCRWPRTKRLYRARIVSSADQQSKSVQDENEEEEESDETSEPVEKRPKDEPAPQEEPVMVSSANTISTVKEEMKPSARNSHQQQHIPAASPAIAPTNVAPARDQPQHQPIISHATAPPASQMPIDPAAIAQALMPTLKKLFNSELSKLSTDIQANFDIIGHKISALDGTVKCIKTRVDRMETLLNTAAQELGDNQTNSAAAINSLGLSPANATRASPLNNTDLLSGAVRNLNAVGSSQSNTGFYNTQQKTPVVSNASQNRYSSTSFNAAAAMKSTASSVSSPMFGNQLQQQRRPVPTGNLPRGVNQQPNSIQSTPGGNRPIPNASFASYSRPNPNSLVSMASVQRPQIPGNSSSVSSALKRRRTTPTTNPPLPKAVVITAPNGIEIYLGGDKNYKMPLVMYKDALKNCTRPIATYMVMALIRRYLTPDEMSRTWLTEQQLLGKKDGILLDQNLLAALKKQSLMQFPGSGIDDRLLVRKLYDVFHGIRRQMRKKRREAGEGNFDQGLGDFGNEHGGGDNGADDDSGSGIDHDDHGLDGLDDDSHNLEQGSGDYDGDQGQDFEGEEYGQDEAAGGDVGDNGNHLDLEHGEDEEDGGGGLIGEGMLNGDEDLEEMAAKQAAFWAGTDDSY